MDSIVVPVPGRAWAIGAIEDLRREGFGAELLGQCPDTGAWRVEVTGSERAIAEIRYALQIPALRVCWESYVNSVIAD